MELCAKELAKQIESQIIEWRREFHRCPELKMDMDLTEKLILKILGEIGITDIRTGIGGKGIAAVIHGALPGKCLGIRADCDGLPVKEETGLPFASTNGNMHACGHDAHTAMALGAAKIIFENRDKLRGSVKMIFQPYEEGDGGARAMIADGVLENPKVDALIALHTGNIYDRGSFHGGEFGWNAKSMSFCITAYRVRFKGVGSHVSTPQFSHDPILAACYATTQIQSIVSRNTDPAHPVIAAVTTIHGGARNNIIPEECVIEGSVRTTTDEEQAFVWNRLVSIVKGVGESMNVEVEAEKIFDLNSSRMDAHLVDIFKKVSRKIVPEEHIREITELTPAGEDFARYTKLVPSLYIFHCSKFNDKTNYPHHNPKFDIDEQYLWSGAAYFAQFAFDWQE